MIVTKSIQRPNKIIIFAFRERVCCYHKIKVLKMTTPKSNYIDTTLDQLYQHQSISVFTRRFSSTQENQESQGGKICDNCSQKLSNLFNTLS